MKVTDGQLVEQARAGDKNAFGELVDRYRDMVYGLGYHLTGNFEDARDLAQEAFVQGYLKLAQLHEPGKFSSWLRQIALNVHRMRRRAPTPITVPIDEEIEMKPRHEPSEIETVVHEALAKLREPERLALTLHYINGYTQSEIGGFLGVQPATVKTRLARARQHLKKEIMAMVEDTFEKKKLPEDFTKNVISAVENLIGDMRAVLPKYIDENLRRNRHEENEKWRNILAKIPSEILPKPLKEQGEAPQIRVSDLPEHLREEVRKAIYITWFDHLLFNVDHTLPWIKDFDSLWIRYFESSEQGWFADTPGNAGTMYSFSLNADDASAQNSQRTEQVNAEFLSDFPVEFRQIISKLLKLIPGEFGSLRASLYAGAAASMRQLREMLPPDMIEAMKTGKSIASRELPENAQNVLRKAIFMHWGYTVLENIEDIPAWLGNYEGSKIEFGVYREVK